MIADRRHILLTLGAAALAGCATAPPTGPSGPRVETANFPDIAFGNWTDAEPEYLLYPGDEIEVATPTAVELTRTLKVGPDGRIALPLVGQVMAGYRTLAEVEGAASAAYASELVRPVVEVTLKTAMPMKVWVAGEVRTPNIYDMTGDMDAYQAIVMAGDFLPTGKSEQVALIRRGPGGRRMMRMVDLRPQSGEVIALRRDDILFVPRNSLGELANFFTLVRNAMPINFTYSINSQYQQF